MVTFCFIDYSALGKDLVGPIRILPNAPGLLSSANSPFHRSLLFVTDVPLSTLSYNVYAG